MIMTIKRTHFTFPIPKNLNEVARVPLLRQECAVKIRQLWLDQFNSRQDVVVGTMARHEYLSFTANTIACPIFLVPLFKPGGSAYFNLVSQFQDGKHCLLTGLDAFRLDPTSAAPMMVSTIYDELISEKEIALVRGDIINRLEISRDDAQRILKFIRHFYINKFDIVRKFNLDARNFDYEDFMKLARDFYATCSP